MMRFDSSNNNNRARLWWVVFGIGTRREIEEDKIRILFVEEPCFEFDE